ncbi:MAG: S-layer homology domain-containing protein [Candidatus Peribacteraceae bacterium]
METPKNIARPLFVLAFASAVTCFAAVNGNEKLQASVGDFVATVSSQLHINTTTELSPIGPYKASCFLGQMDDGVAPNFDDADAGEGYAKMNLSSTDYKSFEEVYCDEPDFSYLIPTFCEANPDGSFQMLVALFNEDGTFRKKGCGMYGCKTTPCAETLKGACMVLDASLYPAAEGSLPSFGDPDEGEGYAKEEVGNYFNTMNRIDSNCEYFSLVDRFCASNPGASYKKLSVGYTQDDANSYVNCYTAACETFTCPATGSATDTPVTGTTTTGGDSDDEEETYGHPAAGYEDEVKAKTNILLQSATFSDPVLTDFSAFKNPFPDTDLTQLTGQAAAELYRRSALGGFPDGEFKSDRPVNRAEAAKFLLLTRDESVKESATNGTFPDVLKGQWYTKYVVAAANEGIIGGYPDGTFKPGNQVKTAEFLKMLTLTFGLEENMNFAYTDVPADSWFAPYAGIAEVYELFPGRSTKLSPDKPLSRGDVAVAIYQYLAHRED